MTYIYHEFRPKGWLYGLYGVGSAGVVCPWPGEVLKVNEWMCDEAERRRQERFARMEQMYC